MTKPLVYVKNASLSGMFQGNLVLLGIREADSLMVRTSIILRMDYDPKTNVTDIETLNTHYLTDGNMIEDHLGMAKHSVEIDEDVAVTWADHMARNIKDCSND